MPQQLQTNGKKFNAALIHFYTLSVHVRHENQLDYIRGIAIYEASSFARIAATAKTVSGKPNAGDNDDD